PRTSTYSARPCSRHPLEVAPAVRLWPAPASAGGKFRPRHGRSRARRLPADHRAHERGRLLSADTARVRPAARVVGTARHGVARHDRPARGGWLVGAAARGIRRADPRVASPPRPARANRPYARVAEAALRSAGERVVPYAP